MNVWLLRALELTLTYQRLIDCLHGNVIRYLSVVHTEKNAAGFVSSIPVQRVWVTNCFAVHKLPYC
jgi:hypothetical protein